MWSDRERGWPAGAIAPSVAAEECSLDDSIWATLGLVVGVLLLILGSRIRRRASQRRGPPREGS